MKPTIILAAALAALPLAAVAQTAPAGAIGVTDAFARSTNPKVGAVFMTIENGGTADCVLSGISAPEITDQAELHTHREENGVMSMVQVDSITIPAGAKHELKRGGDHVMLMGTSRALAEGDEIALTLDFGACGKLPLTVRVDNSAGTPGAAPQGQPAAAPAAGHDAKGHGAHAN